MFSQLFWQTETGQVQGEITAVSSKLTHPSRVCVWDIFAVNFVCCLSLHFTSYIQNDLEYFATQKRNTHSFWPCKICKCGSSYKFKKAKVRMDRQPWCVPFSSTRQRLSFSAMLCFKTTSKHLLNIVFIF